MTRNTVAWFVVAVLSTSIAGAQRRDRPVTPTVEQAATAVVAGRVTESASGDAVAVRRAVVTLVSSEGVDTYSVITDTDGRFALTGVPAGRYSVVAKKSGYLTSTYGARRPGRTGTTLVVAEGQQIADLTLVLPRGGVITGTVRLPDGEPLTNTQVVAIAAADIAAGGRTFSTQRFDTDDRGEYRIYGLLPGEYIVGALPTVGRDVQRRTAAELDAMVAQLKSQQAVPGGMPREVAAPPPVPTVGYTPTYFPGTTIAAQATRLRIGPGGVRENVDIPVDLVRMIRITGTVLGIGGRPTQGAQIQIEAVGPPLPISAALSARVSRPDESGRFEVTNVAPGTYKITARGGGVTFSPGGGMTVRSDQQTEWAAAEVTTFGSDVGGVALQLQPGLSFSGSMVARGQADAPATWKGARVALQPARTGTSVVLNGQVPGGVSARSAAVNDDGTFEVVGIQPATYEVVVTLPPAIGKTWHLQAVLNGNSDLRDAPLTFDQGAIQGARVVLSDAQSRLTGTLFSSSGAAATDYYIVIFPADRALWHPQSPRVRVVRPLGDGTFSAVGLPAGSYRIAALTDVEDNEWRSPTFLESLLEASLAVTMNDGVVTQQEIRIR